MLKTRIRRRAAAGTQAVTHLAAIEASIVALVDDDLLDLADIFGDAATPLAEMATAEMRRRGISL